MNKKDSIERCIKQIRAYYAMKSEVAFKKGQSKGVKGAVVTKSVYKRPSGIVDYAASFITSSPL
ncbi:MAG: hypothetical protein VST71_06790 [Nitrospirota bacterium]|nr:hypothetical protein [Nitrospirota bacterium]